MFHYSEEMKTFSDIDNIQIYIGLGNFHNARYVVGNYLPMKLKYGTGFIDAYFNPPNHIFLCGVMLWKGHLSCKDDSVWSDILSHETMHYVLFKYIGEEARVKFDNISGHSGEYGHDGFSKEEKYD